MLTYIMWQYAVLGILCSIAASQMPQWSADNDTDLYSRSYNTIDKGELFVENSVPGKILIFAKSSNCYRCSFARVGGVGTYKVTHHCKSTNTSLQVNTTFSTEIQLTNKSGHVVCLFTEHFKEHGMYLLTIEPDESFKSDVTDETLSMDKPVPSAICHLTLLNNPPDTNIPVYITLSVIVFVCLIWAALKCLYRHLSSSQAAGPEGRLGSVTGRCLNCCNLLSGISREWEQLIDDTDPHSPAAVSTSSAFPAAAGVGGAEAGSRTSSRILSVDTLRGISLVVMIFVNYGGGQYWYFKHAAWDGLTVADLVFPWFVFVMGVSIVLSYRSAVRRGCGKFSLAYKTVRRFVILFLIGLTLSNHGQNVKISELRVLGVLQRLSITFLVVGLLETFSCHIVPELLINTRRSFVRDLLPYWTTWVFAACLVTIHTCLTFLLPVPDCPRGYLGPGGLHMEGAYENCTGGAAGYIDKVILTPNHMYHGGTYRNVYGSKEPYDPEGILGTLTSIVLCILGLQAGRIIVNFQDKFKMCRRLIVWGIVLGLIAGALCEFRQYGGVIPVNKNLWSLSYILAMASMAFILLFVLYVIVDVYHWWDGSPFVYVGMNSILIYVGHELLEDYFPVQFDVTPSTHWSNLLVDVWGSLFWVIIAMLLHRSRIFIAI